MAVENCLLPDNGESGAESVVGVGGLSPDCSPIFSALQEIYAKYQNDFTGKVPNYIPELARVDPRLFGVALVSADGQMYEVGDSRHLFTIQSISKPLVYALALEDHGVDHVLTKVGSSPPGKPLTRSFSTSAATVHSIRWSTPGRLRRRP